MTAREERRRKLIDRVFEMIMKIENTVADPAASKNQKYTIRTAIVEERQLYL